MGDGVSIDGVLRLVGSQYSPNHTALYLVRTLFVGLGLALSVRAGRRRLWLAPLAVLVAALMLTASRGAMLLGLPAGLATIFWLWSLCSDAPLGERVDALGRRKSVRIALLALPIVVLAMVLLGEARLLNQDSVDSRLLLWRASIDLWRSRPLLGAGPGGFFWTYPAWLPMQAPIEPDLLHPHNVWLELATGWGLVGLFWLSSLIILWAMSAARNIKGLSQELRWQAIGLSAAVGAALAHAQVDAFLALPDLAGWLFVALGLWAAMMRSNRQ